VPTGRIILNAEQATGHYRRSLSRVLLPEDAVAREALVWADAGAELVLYPGRATLALEEGLIRVSLPVLTEQSGPADIMAVFATGTAVAPAGMFAATQARPNGPDVVLDRRAEPLIAATWQALLQLAADAVAPDPPSDLQTAPGELAIIPAPQVGAR
jgi:hypothetical protein